MGKHVIRATRWSLRSMLKIYSRLITLIFALFCAATGQLPKTASAKNAPTVFKGKVFRSSDSTALSNVRIYLQECFLPDYGIYPEYGIYPDYGIIEPLYGVEAFPKSSSGFIDNSTMDITNEDGEFELYLTGDMYHSLRSDQVTDPDGRKRVYATDCVYIEEGTDSSYNVYMNSIATGVDRKPSGLKQSSLMTAYQGTMLQIRIPDWSGQNYRASIINSRGQETATLSTGSDGILRWDTRHVAKGVYFLRLKNEPANLSVKILVK